ncbi:MAG: energy-coupling factor transporter transmembrane protein EcfT [Treponema sp.]|jgi:energy-coupling factor transport system permease protein|nr:energy-coupling factor transporter transmembrane protein EcfT [Treponema sp.]
MTGLLDYAAGQSALHRANPLVKMLLTFSLCAACFLNANPFFILGVIGLTYLLGAAASAALRLLRITRSMLKLAALLFLAQVLVIRSGAPLLRLPLGLLITREGVLFSLVFVLRFLAVALPLALLFSVTRMSDLSNVLNRCFRIPFKYTFSLSTAMRFVPVFAAEMTAIMEAQVSRGVDFDTKNFFRKLRLILPLCAPLLISSVRKIEGAAISAEMRGFSLRKPGAGCKKYPLRPADALFILLSAALIAGGLWRWWGPGLLTKVLACLSAA